MAEFLGIKYTFLVNSGSSANLLAFMALTSPLFQDRKIKRGDEIITVAAGVPVYLWLKLSLGPMKLPVILYIAVISLMTCNAFAVLGSTAADFSGRAMVFSGALLFYVSDIFVARQRFIRDDFTNRLVGLPLYYAAQFLLAFSVSLIK